MSYSETTNLNLKLIDSFTEDENWGNINNDNLDIIDTDIKTASDDLTTLTSYWDSVVDYWRDVSRSLSSYEGYQAFEGLIQIEDRIEDIEAVGEYTCDTTYFDGIESDIADLEAEAITLQASLDAIGLGGSGLTAEFSMLDYSRQGHIFEFEDGLLKDYRNDGLELYYKMDSLTSNVVVDDSGKGNNGTAYNVVYSSTGGVSNGYFDFSNSTSYVSLHTSGTVSLGNNWTISLWVKNTDTTNNQTLVRLNSLIDSFELKFTASSSNNLSVIVNTTEYTFGSSPIGSTWRHVALSYQEGFVVVYVDGVISGDLAFVGSLDFSSDKYIDLSSFTNGYSGYMDQFYLYNCALSRYDIQYLYNIGV